MMKSIMLAAFVFSVFFCVFAGDTLRARAEKGEPSAMFEACSEYFTVRRRIRLFGRRYLYGLAAEKGLPEAMFNYAWCLENGAGVKKDEFRAYDLYTKAAAKGLPDAAFARAMLLMRGIENRLPRDVSSAKTQLEKLAVEKVYPPACAEFARILLQEEDNPFAASRAFRILSDGVRKESTYASVYTLLADCYYNGRGTLPDVKKAVPFLEKASSLGDAEASLKLAFIFESGLSGGVPDIPKAVGYYKLASGLGVAEARYKLANFMILGLAEGSSEDAEKLYVLASEQGHAGASFKVAMMKLERDDDKRPAVEQLFSLAKRGDADSMYELARLMSGERKILKVDEKNAFFWFKSAADAGVAAAQRETAVCYFNGRGCVQNDSEGGRYLRLAARNGDVLAVQMLSRNSRSPW